MSQQIARLSCSLPQNIFSLKTNSLRGTAMLQIGEYKSSTEDLINLPSRPAESFLVFKNLIPEHYLLEMGVAGAHKELPIFFAVLSRIVVL
jgi:hypothetical protein